jgi:hypothetical protein
MSRIALSPPASGTATFTLSAPATNTDRTLTLPDAAGTIQVSGNPISGTTGTFTGLVDISAAGAGQIAFPATQNASANANTLDDYEEGTWTPAFIGGGTVTYQTASTQGRYTKIGRIVCASGVVTSTALTSSSALVTISLPFTVANNQANFTPSSFFIEEGVNPTGGAGNIQGIANQNTANMGLYVIASSTVANYVFLKYSDVQSAANTRIRFSVVYETSA